MYCNASAFGLGQAGTLAAIGIGGFWLRDGLLFLLAVSILMSANYLFHLWKGTKELREEGWL